MDAMITRTQRGGEGKGRPRTRTIMSRAAAQTVSSKDNFGVAFAFQSFQPWADDEEEEILDRPEVG